MFQNAVFGDNATILVGDHSAITVKNTVKRGDFGSLAAVLKENGVSEEDIVSLGNSITEDQGAVDIENKSFGPAVKGWMLAMMGKAINAAWNIELGVASSLLASALEAYYFS
jgi:hypothetical protein